MAVRTRTQLLADIDEKLPIQTTGQITSEKIQAVTKDTVQSSLFPEDLKGADVKGSIADADQLHINDSAASDAIKKITFLVLKNAIWTAFGALINGGESKSAPVDNDQFALMDSQASNASKKLSWANLKAAIKTYADGLYAPLGRTFSAGTGLTGGGTFAANRTFAADFGTGAGKVAEGNDPRIVGALQPTGEGQGPIMGGAAVTYKDLGNLSGQSITIDPSACPSQKITNNGAGSIIPSTTKFNSGRLIVVNAAGAGAVTLPWTKVVGEFTTSPTAKFLCGYEIWPDFSVLTIEKEVA